MFLDITASHEQREILLDVVRRTAEVVFMPLTVGGGIRTLEDIRMLLKAGCDKVSINSAAAKNLDLQRRGKRSSPAVSALSSTSIPNASGRTGLKCEGVRQRRSRPHGIAGGRVGALRGALGAGEIVPHLLDADGTKNGYDLEMHAGSRRRR